MALRTHNTTFASLATFTTFDGSLAGAAEPVLVRAGSTSWLGAAGVVPGTAGAAAATRLLSPFLFEATPTDVSTFAAVAATMFAAALLAGAIPAGRATRINPLLALRHE